MKKSTIKNQVKIAPKRIGVHPSASKQTLSPVSSRGRFINPIHNIEKLEEKKP